MNRDEFNKTVRPYVREFPIGQRGIGFDRQELDAWADDYIKRNAIQKVSPSRMASQINPGKRKTEAQIEEAVAAVLSKRKKAQAKPTHATKQ
ncbi:MULTISPECIES: hypothetical protein [Pseudomonas]|uniref:Uncharacterized protein n=1 Tax=Pseudomonas luteola TaxID=47886 RepID=A0ABS0FI20_PSELU|nr:MULTISPECIES: hypothetical protein [Pseudomonas]MBF8639987.1 hypothetical protein [Pseudomonas zeshuii]RRW44216.1 hypothetical protein EGJ50_17055 [Pseudomonas luteola]